MDPFQCFKRLKAVPRCFAQIRRSISLNAKQGVSINLKTIMIIKIKNIKNKKNTNKIT